MNTVRSVLAAVLVSVCGVAVAQDCPPIVVRDDWTLLSELTVLDLASTRVRSNAAGYLAYWYGPAGTNGIKPLSFVFLTAAQATPTYLSDVMREVAAYGVAGAMKQRQTLSADDPAARAIWCPFWTEMHAGKLPPPALRVVNTRTYTVWRAPVVGALLTPAPIGATCSCPAAPLVISGKTYCTFAGARAPTVVAECAAPARD